MKSFVQYYTPEMLAAAKEPLAGYKRFVSDGPSGPRFFHSVICALNPGFEAALNPASVKHDFAYWKGGTDAERLAADSEFRDALKRWPRLAEMYFQGVRSGGKPNTGLSWQWGYGRIQM